MLIDDLNSKVKDALNNPFVPIHAIHKSYPQQNIPTESLLSILKKENAFQIETLAIIHQQPKRTVRDLLPKLLKILQRSTDDQFTFSLISMLNIFLRDSSQEPQSKYEFINIVLKKLENSSEINCLLFIEILRQQEFEKEEINFSNEIQCYVNFAWSKSVQLSFISFALEYAVKTDRPMLICYWFNSIIDIGYNAPDSFTKNFLELLIYFSNQLQENVFKNMEYFDAILNIKALSAQSQRLVLKLMSKTTRKLDDEFLIEFIHVLDNSSSILNDPQNLSLVIPILQDLSKRSSSNCIAFFSCKELLKLIFNVFTSNNTNTDFEQSIIDICVDLLKNNICPEIIEFYQDHKVIPKIYSIIMEFLSYAYCRQYYSVQAVQVAYQILVYQNYWEFDDKRSLLFAFFKKQFEQIPGHDLPEFELSLVNVILLTIERCMLKTKIKYRMQQIDFLSFPNWIKQFERCAVHPFCDKNINQIFFNKQHFTTILFQNKLERKGLAEAYKEAAITWRSYLDRNRDKEGLNQPINGKLAVTWRVDNKKSLIFTDIPTEAEHYGGLAQYIKIDFNKSPIVLIDGAKRTKYVLTKAPLDITSADIIAFVGSVENGSAKEYKVDEKVEYEGENWIYE